MFLLLRALSCFVSAGIDAALDRRAGWENWSISILYSTRWFLGNVTHNTGQNHIPSGDSSRLMQGSATSYCAVYSAALCSLCSCLMIFYEIPLWADFPYFPSRSVWKTNWQEGEDHHMLLSCIDLITFGFFSLKRSLVTRTASCSRSNRNTI